MLAKFDFEVVHRLGKSNVVAYALSRLNVVQCGAASRGHHREDLFRGLEQTYKNDKETKMIMHNLDVHRDFVSSKINCTIQGRDRCSCTFPWGSFGISLCKSATIPAMVDI